VVADANWEWNIHDVIGKEDIDGAIHYIANVNTQICSKTDNRAGGLF
jgi:hypothetical protein